MSLKKKILVGAFALAIIGIVVASLVPKREKAIEVKTSVVERESITRKVTAAGKLQPATEVRVSSNLTGDLLELTVKEGDEVAKGQLLARIDSRRYVAQVRQQNALLNSARAQLEVARVRQAQLGVEARRLHDLLKANTVSTAEVERADADLASQRAQLQAAREDVARTEASLAEAQHLLSLATIHAPIAGIVTSRLKQVGERVRGSDFTEDVLLVIATLSAMEVRVEVGEHEVVHLREGNEAEVEIDAFPDEVFPAHVVEIARAAQIRNPNTEAEVTTFPVRLALTRAPVGALPGMSAEATILTETHDDAVVVPIQAVTARKESELEKEEGDGRSEDEKDAAAGEETSRKKDPLRKIVFVVADGVAEVRRVETGLADEDNVEIVSGLQAGEEIVRGPYRVLAHELEDGKPVEAGKKDEASKETDVGTGDDGVAKVGAEGEGAQAGGANADEVVDEDAGAKDDKGG